MGCEIDVNHAGRDYFFVTAKPADQYTEGELCAKGRFGTYYIGSRERLYACTVRGRGRVEMPEAAAALHAGLARTREAHGPDALLFLVSPRVSTEAAWLFASLAKREGTRFVFPAEDLRRAGPVAARARQHGRDVQALELLEREVVADGRSAGRLVRGGCREEARHRRRVAERPEVDRRALDDVLELAHVSRPAVPGQQLERVLGCGSEAGEAEPRQHAAAEVLDQQREVARPLAQGGQLDGVAGQQSGVAEVAYLITQVGGTHIPATDEPEDDECDRGREPARPLVKTTCPQAVL